MEIEFDVLRTCDPKPEVAQLIHTNPPIPQCHYDTMQDVLRGACRTHKCRHGLGSEHMKPGDGVVAGFSCKPYSTRLAHRFSGACKQHKDHGHDDMFLEGIHTHPVKFAIAEIVTGYEKKSKVGITDDDVASSERFQASITSRGVYSVKKFHISGRDWIDAFRGDRLLLYTNRA